MARQIFVNLPVRDMARAQAFFRALGFDFDPRFTDDKGACMVVEPGSIHVMLLTQPFFQGFTGKSVADATRTTEVLVALSCASREEVDETVRKAVAAGGRVARPAQDHGFMYQHAFEDPDGHIWELVWMNPAALPGAA